MSEDSLLSPITQTFISRIVLDLLKPLYPNKFEEIQSFDFNQLIFFFESVIPHLELPDLDPNNPIVSAVRLAKKHFDSDDNFVEELAPTVPNLLGLVPSLKVFFQQHISDDLPSDDELIQCLQELGFCYLRHIAGFTVTVSYG